MRPLGRSGKLMGAAAAICLVVALCSAAPTVTAGSSWTFELQCADPSGPAVTLCDAYLDPDVHHGSLGTELYHATSAGKGRVTAAIPSGIHKVAVRSEAEVSGGTNTSVIVVTVSDTALCQPGWAMLGYQSWWADTGQDPAFGSRHAHVDDLCVPVNNKIVDGSQTFSWKVQLHNQPAGARLTRVRISDYWSGGSTNERWKYPGTLPQPDANGNLVFPASATINLSALATGRHEFRWGVYVTQPNGKVQLLSSRTEICIRSCNPSYRSLSSYPVMQGNGAWYEKDGDPGYVDGRIVSDIPTFGTVPSPTPTPTPTPLITPPPSLTPAPSVCG